MMRLDGKTALITGGGKGIGAEITKRFVSEGAKVCITGRSIDTLNSLASEFPSGKVAVCAGDVSVEKDVQYMVDTAVSFGDGRVDVLVNNAGIDPAGSVVELDPAVWRKVMDINLTGPFLVMKAVIPHMVRSGGGSIINIASLGGLRSLPGMPAYAASKGGLIMLTKQVALDYGVSKVRCNVVCPGATRTSMLEGSLGPLAEKMDTDVDGVFKHISSTVPLRRVAQPEEMAGVCCFLAGEDSSFMTGAVLLVDGGAAMVDVSGATLSMAGIDWGVA